MLAPLAVTSYSCGDIAGVRKTILEVWFMLMEGMEGKAKQLCKPLVVARNSKAGRRGGRRRNPWQEPLITIPSKEKVHGSLGQHTAVLGHVGLG